MKLKSYFADSVEAAMTQAGQELGSDAMLVYSRQSPIEARHLGAYEVVFGMSSDSEIDATTPVSSPEPTAPAAREPFESARGTEAFGILQRELGDLRSQVNRLANVIARNGSSCSFSGLLSSEIEALNEELLAADLDADLLHEVLLRLREDPDIEGLASAPDPMSQLRSAFRRELATMFSVDSTIGKTSGGAKIIALVGPPGAGKTSALVKLAARYAVRESKPAQLLSVDMYRIGAAEQLRSFAAILGIGFQAIDTNGALAQSLAEHHHKDLVLIDTPGHSEQDIDASADLAAFLCSNPEIDVHLTLPASMKAADLKNAAARYQRFQPSKLLLTKLDEAASLGTVLAESIRLRLPVSFLSTGQQIPEDIEAATTERILDGVFARDSADALEPGFAGQPSISDLCWEGSVAERAAAA